MTFPRSTSQTLTPNRSPMLHTMNEKRFGSKEVLGREVLKHDRVLNAMDENYRIRVGDSEADCAASIHALPTDSSEMYRPPSQSLWSVLHFAGSAAIGFMRRCGQMIWILIR